MEVGRPPESAISPITPPTVALDTRDRNADAVSSKLAGPLAAEPGTSSGYSRGWFTDPIAIWVNSEQVDLSWIWTSPLSCAYLYSWSRSVPASFVGWFNVFNYTYPTQICTGQILPFSSARAETLSNWQNNVFPACLGSPANAYYNTISVSGDNYGTLHGNMSWNLTGPACINLLTPNFQLVRTYN